MNTKKILGYKAPFGIFRNSIPKGSLYIKRQEDDNGYHLENNLENVTYYLPDEIVETWEPVYEETEEEMLIKIINHVIDDVKQTIPVSFTIKAILSKYEIKRKL